MSQSTAIQTHYRACNLCEAICGLEIQHNGQEILSIRGDKNDPFSKGYICPKAMGLKDVYYDPDRLKHPVKRVGEEWVTITWEEAFDEVAQRLKNIQDQYGRDSVATYLGNPNVHNIGSMLSLSHWLKTLRSKNCFSATSADQLPHHVASLEMFGHYMMIPIPDIDRSQLMIIFGANPLASNGSMMTAPGMSRRLRALQKRGGRIIVIDPRRTETADKADEHLFIRPGRDVLLLLGMIHTLFDEQLVKLNRVADFTDGLSHLEEAVKAFSPEAVSKSLGMSSEKIRLLAREFAQTPKAVCYGRMGVSTQAYGGLCQWLINALNIITGHLDQEGGAMFTQPAFDYIAAGKKGAFGRWHSRVRQLPEFRGELPVAVMAEEMQTPGEGQIKALMTIAGNPVLSTANGSQLAKAIEQLDFVVAIDIYINETTRHADIILPPATGLEVPHYDMVFLALSVRDSAKFSKPMFEKAEGALYDWEIVKALVQRLGGAAERIVDPELMIEKALQFGPYAKQGLDLQQLKDHPSGIDLGALKPALPHRLFTKDQRIQLAPSLFVNDLKRVEHLLQQKDHPSFPFQLIGRRHLRSNNSWMHNSYRLVKGPDRCTLLLHPDDAQTLSISDGEQVEVQSRVGTVQVKTEVSDTIMPGVVSLPHGWGHHRKGVRLSVASQYAGVSINDLTDEMQIDELTGNAAFSGVWVKISPLVNG
ncbi:MAG: molybdopterin oxidoreductase family protein [Bacteroidota bacterium]